MSLRTFMFPAGAALGLALAAAPAAAAEQDVVVRFAAKVGAAPLACGKTYSGIGATGAAITLQDFRVYVSNLRLVDAKGGETPVRIASDGRWQDDKTALLDFEDATGNCNGNAAVNREVRGKAAPGRYVGLVFDLGVPADRNHQDTTRAGPPLNFSALSWPWRAGYKFLTIDIETSAPGRPNASGFSIHLGSTDCPSGPLTAPPTSPCARQNRPTYRFAAFDPARQSVVFDLAELLKATDVTTNAPNTAAGCMSGQTDDDCAAIMPALGVPFRDLTPKDQSWARVE
ncbi:MULTISPECIES: MbnP family copper-binding protein [Phenylobacterium]|uniref:MbnP family copper-binding protein n=1 Tax=Phenylobacterium conjunctum TaxID=1298959 RepID=A0ABW3SXM8_9CAUL